MVANIKKPIVIFLTVILLLVIFFIGHSRIARKSLPPAVPPTPRPTTLFAVTSTPSASKPLNKNHSETLQKLGIKETGFYKEYTAKPSSFHPAQLGRYTEACIKGGYDLSARLDKDLAFTGYRTDVLYQVARGMENEVVKEEPLNVWVISSDSETVCIYLTVKEDSTMAPGIFSVSDPFLKFPSFGAVD